MKSPALTELKKTLRENPAPAAPTPKAPAPAAPAPEPEIDDATLFAQATRGVQRIASDAPPPAAARRPDANVLRRRAAAVAEDAPNAPISDTAALMHAVTPEESLAFARNGVQQRVMQKLRQGQPHWQAAVDLHGCSVDEARDAVLTLLRDARQEGLQAVKIVHGKGLMQGQPLLKTCVNGWLRQLPDVLAFASALPRDGGTGAVYVLLKRKREDA
ncbi:MAG: mismatch repair protein MutS [Moraxellaceae bacterium]|jgi:DNA-nicking Smr family endonuclease|nr:mismatch repair protein MutS [Moraxellaceae bacterium]